jgi:hypothetical protein
MYTNTQICVSAVHLAFRELNKVAMKREPKQKKAKTTKGRKKAAHTGRVN